jgi:type II secretory pathway pseudopilin PulG
MAIIGILSVILLRSYTWVTEATFRVQQTKNVHQEALHLAQVIQNFADNNTIDYPAYS